MINTNNKNSFFYHFVIFSLLIIFTTSTQTYPVALFHGIGDSCNFKGVKEFTNYISNRLETLVKCIEIGNGFISSWFMEFTKQAEEACNKVKNDELFKNEFSIVGISQGSLIGRYIIEKCDMPGRVLRYVSFDGPQMGIGTLPKITCPIICSAINSIVSKVIYNDYFEKNLAPVGYYRYRYSNEDFLKYSKFLADLNNEREIKFPNYKSRFSNLEKILLIKNKEDSVITPRDSAWFEFYDKNGGNIVPLKNSDFYLLDFIGLRYLDEQGRLFKAEFQGDHVIYTNNEIDMYIIPILR